MTLWFASGNIHKKKELTEILGLELKIPKDAGLEFNPIESGSSFLENAMIKALELFRLLNSADYFKAGDALIADDSGLCVDALNGRPGIYSSRYSGPPGSPFNEPLSDADRNALLLDEMSGRQNRSARFICAMILLFSSDNFYIVQESCEGRIVKNAEEIRGSGGFGYDPVFQIPELNTTAAELSEKEKNRISHRGKAGKRIAAILGNRDQGTGARD